MAIVKGLFTNKELKYVANYFKVKRNTNCMHRSQQENHLKHSSSRIYSLRHYSSIQRREKFIFWIK